METVFNRMEAGVELLRIYQPKIADNNIAKYYWVAKSDVIKHQKTRRYSFKSHRKEPNQDFFTKIMEHPDSYHVHLHPAIILTSPKRNVLADEITAQDLLDLSEQNGTYQFFLVHDMAESTKNKARKWLKWCKKLGLKVTKVATQTKGSRCRLGRM